MKLAVLLLVHGNPNGIVRLVEKLADPDITFFVHVDKKFPIAPYIDALSEFDNIVVLPDTQRVKVNWGGRSQIDAILQLMQSAMASKTDFNRFASLTGADYPICTPQSLLTALAATQVEIIRVDRILSRETENKIRPISLHDVGWLNPRNTKGLKSWIFTQVLRAIRLLKSDVFPDQLSVVHGSSSHCLSKAAVAQILAFHDQKPEFYDMLRQSFSTDEIYFHTILVNSGFKLLQNYAAQPAQNSNVHGMHYIDWGADVRPLPKTLDLEDLHRIAAAQGAMFVRKVDPANTAFLDKLDQIALDRATPR